MFSGPTCRRPASWELTKHLTFCNWKIIFPSYLCKGIGYVTLEGQGRSQKTMDDSKSEMRFFSEDGGTSTVQASGENVQAGRDCIF